MIYIQYENCKNKYYAAQKEYERIVDERETLFMKTQPKATDTTKDRVSGGANNNAFDNYLIQKEKKQLDVRLEEARSILNDRKELFRLKEEELRKSTNIHDRIYTHKFLDNMKVYKIARLVGYGEAQIYRILKIIRKNIKGRDDVERN